LNPAGLGLTKTNFRLRNQKGRSNLLERPFLFSDSNSKPCKTTRAVPRQPLYSVAAAACKIPPMNLAQ
jgi:hypothetical protein